MQIRPEVLLILPPCFISREPDFEIGFPVNLIILARAARLAGWTPKFLDMSLEEKNGNDSFAELDKRLKRKNLRAIGVSNHTVRTSVTTKAVAARVKSARPDLSIIVGGVNATFMWERLMAECEAIDFVLRGYAQSAFTALLQEISRNNDILPGPGLVVKGKTNHSVEPTQKSDENDFIFEGFQGLGVRRYLEWTQTYPLLTHTGCGFSCNFCTSVMPGPYQNKEVSRSIDNIIAEMRKAVTVGFRRFFMSANIFTSNRDRTSSLCDAICKAQLNKRADWVCMTRVEFVDQNLLNKMKEAGCVNIAFGVEGASPEQWKSLNKGRYSHDTVARAFRQTKEAGIGTTAFLIIGTPNQTSQDLESTIGVVREIDPDFRVVSFFQPFPGTPYGQEPAAFGLSELEPLEKWNFHEAPICRTRHLDKPSMLQAAVRMYLERGSSGEFNPDIHALELREAELDDGSTPEEVTAVLPLLDGKTPIASLLERITAQYGYRGRLIVLYWLSAGMREKTLALSTSDTTPDDCTLIETNTF